MIRFPLLAVSALVLGTALAIPAHAQPSPTPIPTPPPGATGLCNDGTYCYNHDINRACRNHGGVKEWFDAPSEQSNAGPDVDMIPPGDTPAHLFEIAIAASPT